MQLKEIGIIRSPYLTRKNAPRQGHLSEEICTIEVYEEYRQALYRIEDYERLIILYWLHQGNRETLQVFPRGQKELKGVFASRSPDRPNPLGLSVVKLVKKTGNILKVVGLDAIDQTPLLDIKPDLD